MTSPARARPPAAIGDQNAVSGYRGPPARRTRSSTTTTAPGTSPRPTFTHRPRTTSTSSSAAATIPTRHHHQPADVGQPRRRRHRRAHQAPGRDGERSTVDQLGRRRDLKGKTARIDDRRREHRRLGPHPGRPVRPRRRAREVPALDRDRGQPARRRQGRAHAPPARTARRSTGASWDVACAAGKTARIQIVDRNSGGWGHILADQFTFADAAAQSLLDRAQLARLRQGLLRRGVLERRARRQADHDRLDEQLALRRRRSRPRPGAAR